MVSWCMASAKRNLHVPLTEDLDRKLRAEAARTGEPATQIAREGIRTFLELRRRRAIREAIQSYAHSIAGTREDLDPEIESAAIESLLESEESG